MFCPFCGSENPEGARFCKVCGKELPNLGNQVVEPTGPETGATRGAAGATGNCGAGVIGNTAAGNCGANRPGGNAAGYYGAGGPGAGNGRAYYDFGSENFPGRPRPKNNLVLSIIVAVIFSRIFGIIAVIFSVLSDDAWKQGREDKAYSYASTSKILSIVGLVLGSIFILAIIAILFYAIVVGANAADSTDWYTYGYALNA